MSTILLPGDIVSEKINQDKQTVNVTWKCQLCDYEMSESTDRLLVVSMNGITKIASTIKFPMQCGSFDLESQHRCNSRFAYIIKQKLESK